MKQVHLKTIWPILSAFLIFRQHAECCRYSAAPDDNLLKHLAFIYSSKHSYMINGNNCVSDNFKNGITNGADWYDVEGGMQDFNYIYGSTIDITFELSCCKYPDASKLPDEWISNRESLMSYMEHVHMGVKGEFSLIKFRIISFSIFFITFQYVDYEF